MVAKKKYVMPEIDRREAGPQETGLMIAFAEELRLFIFVGRNQLEMP